MAEQKQSTPGLVGSAIRITVGLAALVLLALKGLGVGISWFTILGVLAIPGTLAAVGVGVAIPALIVVGIASLASSNSSK